MKIILTSAQQLDIAANKATERADLNGGTITVRWLKSSCLHHVFVGSRRPPIQAFESTAAAWDYLREQHGITQPIKSK